MPSALWSQLSARAGRNDLPAILVEAYITAQLTEPEDIGYAVCHAFAAAEWPGRIAPNEVWADLFTAGVHDTATEYLKDGEIRPRDELPDELTLYRGAQENHKAGMSWTTDREQALWFRNRFTSLFPANLYMVTWPSECVLATLDRRNEHEVIVDPYYLGVFPEDILEIAPV